MKANLASYKTLEEDFKKLARERKYSHAYLFFGGNERDREDKFVFARSLANFLEKGEFKEPDKPLIETLLIKRDSLAYILAGEEEKNSIGIDAVRGLKNFLYQKPVFSDYRIVVIREAERLTPEAQAALLKIVEEPPASSLIILIARNENNVFAALRSRLQKIYFPPQPRGAQERGVLAATDFSLDEIVENDKVDEYFELLLADLGREPIKNFLKLKEALRRLTLIKRFKVNKRLQLRALGAILRSG